MSDLTESFKNNHGLHGLLVGLGTIFILKPITPNYNKIIGVATGIATYYYMTRNENKTDVVIPSLPATTDIPQEDLVINDLPEEYFPVQPLFLNSGVLRQY